MNINGVFCTVKLIDRGNRNMPNLTVSRTNVLQGQCISIITAYGLVAWINISLHLCAPKIAILHNNESRKNKKTFSKNKHLNT